MPHFDTRVGPLVRKDTASDVVEALAKGRVTRVGERTAGVTPIATGALRTEHVGSEGSDFAAGSGGVLVEGAAVIGVERVLVEILVVDTLNHVDLAGSRPRISGRPPRGPDATAVWHRVEVGDEQTVAERLLGADADPIS